MQNRTTLHDSTPSMPTLKAARESSWLLCCLAMCVAACAVGDDAEQSAAINNRAPQVETCQSDDTPPPCDRFLLRASKSLTDLPSSYQFTMGSTRCDGGSEFSVDAVAGTVEFEYRLLENPVDVPGHVDFSSAAWDQSGRFFQEIQGGWRVDVESLDHLGDGVHSAAVQFRARPVDDNRQPVGVAWSDWVQVNHATRYGLLRVSDYWSVAPDHGPLSYSGTNFARCQDFSAEIGWREPGAFERDGDPTPTTNASAVMYFTKSNRFGYHSPGFEWGGANNPLWDQGDAFNLFWVDTPKPYPADGNPYERWIMSNATEWHCDPDFSQYDEPDDGAFENSTCRAMGDGTVASVADTYFSRPATNDPDLRNYILAPEYVGQGWGIGAVHGSPGSTNLWAVHANIWRSNELPGVTGSPREVLQLKYYEGPSDYLTNPNTPWGHREDWYLDTTGPLRIEGRNVGQSAGHGDSLARRRVGAPQDPDIMHREVLKAPHYCMTRQGAGTCTLQRLEVE